MSTLITFEEVGLAYRRALNPFSEKNWVLQDISFELHRGEVLGVIGRNGAGKSTLLRLLSDIINPDRGRIRREPGIRSQLLTLNLGFIHKLTGYDNALLSLVTQGISIRDAKAMIPDIVEFAEIEHLMGHQVSTYSAGERSRLGFSIALKATPDVVLLDEMLGVGDRDFQLKSYKALRDWVKSDQTAVLVSHSASALKECCKRVIWIEEGRVMAQGDTDEILEAYNNFTPPKPQRT